MRNGKMATIKGPVRIEPDNLTDFLSKTSIRLPFEAINWKSERGMDLIPEKYKKKKEKITPRKKSKKVRKK